MKKNYVVYCEPCGYKQVIADPSNSGLHECPVTVVQGRLPGKNKAEDAGKKPIESMPKFRCPRCGRAVTLRKSNTPQPKEPSDEKPPGAA